MKNSICLSHKSDNWKTPKELYDYFINYLGCIDTFEYCSKEDQYEKMYQQELLFMNPPFSHLRTDKFLRYVNSLLLNGNTIYLLMPVRTDTKYFHYLVRYIEHIYFFSGRLKFSNSLPAPFPTMLLVLDYSVYLKPFEFTKCSFLTVDSFIEGRCQ